LLDRFREPRIAADHTRYRAAPSARRSPSQLSKIIRVNGG
jgi:hypothetical protein